MSSKTNPRTEAKYKPTLRAVHGYWKDRDQERKTTVSPQEIQQVRSVKAEPTSPAAWNRLLDRKINEAF